jgi:AraC-like DNA-binding protein
MSQRSSSDNWISARHLKHFIARGGAAGFDVEALLHESGIAPALLSNEESLVPVALIEAALEVMAQQKHGQLFGLQLAMDIPPATFGVLGLLAQSCPTFADVLAVVTRYNGLLSNIGHTSVHYSPGRVHLRWQCLAGGPRFRQHATEYVLASFVVLGRALMRNGQLEPEQVRFAHAGPSHAARMSEYQSVLRCPVYFDAEQSELIFSCELLNAPLHHADSALRQTLQLYADELLERRRQPPLVSDEVSRLIASLFELGAVGAEAVASQLGISTRHLYRKLSQEGVSYKVLLDRVRLEKAKHCLWHSNDTMEVLAEGLGFQSRQTFMRWFKASAGMTAGQYRLMRQSTDTTIKGE